jgi:hypothetical protein
MDLRISVLSFFTAYQFVGRNHQGLVAKRRSELAHPGYDYFRLVRDGGEKP